MDACVTKRWGWAFLPWALLIAAGCHTTQPVTEEFATAPVHQVHVIWSDKIAVTTDVGHNQGADLPGLVGRLYLMGPDLGHTVRSNGRVLVDLYDAEQPAQPKFLGRWQIAKETVARLGQKDRMGLGYTLFLPLPPDFKQDTAKYQLQVSYVPDEGQPMFAARSTVTLNKDEFKLLAATIRPQPIGQEQHRVTAETNPAKGSPVPQGPVLVNAQETH